MSDILNYTAHQFVGYVLSLLVYAFGGTAIRPLVRKLREATGVTKFMEENFLIGDEISPSIIGFIGRAVYSISVIIDKYELIAIWLILNLGGNWLNVSKIELTPRKSDSGDQRNKNFDRSMYYISLIGAGLSLAYGVAAGYVFKMSLDRKPLFYIIGLTILPFLFNYFLYWETLRIYKKKRESSKLI